MIRLIDAEAVLRKVTVKTAFQEDLTRILGDPIQLQQVILNLLMNALDAVREKAKEKDRSKYGQEQWTAMPRL